MTSGLPTTLPERLKAHQRVVGRPPLAAEIELLPLTAETEVSGIATFAMAEEALCWVPAFPHCEILLP